MKARRFVLAASIAVCGVWIAVEVPADGKIGVLPMTPLPRSMRPEGSMPALTGAVEWLNSKPLTPTDLRGKVVLINFWTYSCINWQRTLPHVRAWAHKYKDQGLVVIGVHTPEFGFETDIDNVRRASAQLKVDHPIAVDSERTIWRAFNNRYWPALYFVDARGTIRHHQFGEGDYEQSERVIQQLLVEAGAKGVDAGLVQVAGTGSQHEADWGDLRSPETYIGYDRSERFASPGGMATSKQPLYAAPTWLGPNFWALAGHWRIEAESATLERASGSILYHFHARDLHLVMGPVVRGTSVPFRILIDGRPPGIAHGADVDEDGRGVLVEQRLYQLVRQPEPILDRQFEIEFLEPGVAAYSFTFG